MNFKDDFYFHPQSNQVYFDNSATTQKLQVVIDSANDYYKRGVAAYGRGEGPLGKRTKELYDNAKTSVAQYFGAKNTELIITKSATEALNLCFFNFSHLLQKDDIVLMSVSEHNSVFVPLKRLSETIGIQIEIIPITESGELDYEVLNEKLNNPQVRLFICSSVSNVLGVQNNLKKIAKSLKIANKKRSTNQQVLSLIDNAGNMLGERLNFTQSGFDLMILSFHKMYALSSGALLIKENLFKESWQPELVGGGIVGIIDAHTPYKEMLVNNPQQIFMAGVPDTSQLIAAQAATTWLAEHHAEHLAYLKELTAYLITKLSSIPHLRILGAPENRVNIVSFVHDKWRATDIGTALAQQGIDVRVGRHCADVLYEFLDIPESVRLSLAAYNTREEVDFVISCLKNLPSKLWSN